MINVAIVEDDLSAAELLGQHLDRYAAEKKVEFNIVHYVAASEFLWSFKSNFDLIFMDIGLPDKDGMDLSRELRKLDKTVVLIFVTSMAQFAVSGYEVDALDFIVKPVDYYSFVIKMNRALERIRSTADCELVLSNESGMVRIKTGELKYVEISRHRLVYHTSHGDFNATGTLKTVEAKLGDGCANFVRCNSCYLVNLRYVTSIRGNVAVVGGDELLISHPRHREFLKAVNDYFGGGRNV